MTVMVGGVVSQPPLYHVDQLGQVTASVSVAVPLTSTVLPVENTTGAGSLFTVVVLLMPLVTKV